MDENDPVLVDPGQELVSVVPVREGQSRSQPGSINDLSDHFETYGLTDRESADDWRRRVTSVPYYSGGYMGRQLNYRREPVPSPFPATPLPGGFSGASALRDGPLGQILDTTVMFDAYDLAVFNEERRRLDAVEDSRYPVRSEAVPFGDLSRPTMGVNKGDKMAISPFSSRLGLVQGSALHDSFGLNSSSHSIGSHMELPQASPATIPRRRRVRVHLGHADP